MPGVPSSRAHARKCFWWAACSGKHHTAHQRISLLSFSCISRLSLLSLSVLFSFVLSFFPLFIFFLSLSFRLCCFFFLFLFIFLFILSCLSLSVIFLLLACFSFSLSLFSLFLSLSLCLYLSLFVFPCLSLSFSFSCSFLVLSSSLSLSLSFTFSLSLFLLLSLSLFLSSFSLSLSLSLLSFSFSLDLAKVCTCHAICTRPCESAAPATKSVPDLAKVLRLPRNLYPTLRKRFALRWAVRRDCAETGQTGVETEVAHIDADLPTPAERHSFSRFLFPRHTPTRVFWRAFILHLTSALTICVRFFFACAI